VNPTLKLIGRDTELFSEDILNLQQQLCDIVSSSSFLVIGGAGSIGQAVVEEIFKRNPSKLHIVDINENGLTELVRNLRSTIGYNDGEFATFVLDAGSKEYDAFVKCDGRYDYVLNLSALKHVRSEKDPFTLMRMINVNILNTKKTAIQAIEHKAKKYFCVSTDKAANPVNMMGASKRIMEMFLHQQSSRIAISSARFANVAFSEGSLLAGFANRIQKRQPIAAPTDVRRYFVTLKESGELCLLSCLLGENADIFFPKLQPDMHLITFSDIAVRYLANLGLEPYLCSSEEEARRSVEDKYKVGRWPCYFFKSDTSGEKDFEEFFTDNETLDMKRFKGVGVIKNKMNVEVSKLNYFEDEISKLVDRQQWTKQDLKRLFLELIPNFDHKETGKYLDGKM
jgi:FlaA1/EpsC-like NDP-sugar epimerase